MRVPISHDLGKDEVRRRLKNSDREIADQLPGGVAEVETAWPSEDRMNLAVKSMGQVIHGYVEIEDTCLIFNLDLPAALSFLKPMISAAIEKKGAKLLARPT